jgi:hypothetical protein
LAAFEIPPGRIQDHIIQPCRRLCVGVLAVEPGQFGIARQIFGVQRVLAAHFRS